MQVNCSIEQDRQGWYHLFSVRTVLSLSLSIILREPKCSKRSTFYSVSFYGTVSTDLVVVISMLPSAGNYRGLKMTKCMGKPEIFVLGVCASIAGKMPYIKCRYCTHQATHEDILVGYNGITFVTPEANACKRWKDRMKKIGKHVVCLYLTVSCEQELKENVCCNYSIDGIGRKLQRWWRCSPGGFYTLRWKISKPRALFQDLFWQV